MSTHTTDAQAAQPEMPWIVAAGLIFWGWHTGLWWLALPLAFLAEAPRLYGWRWELERTERERVGDLCSVLAVLAGLYLWLDQPRLGSALILLIQWLPAILFPLLAVQVYSRHQGVELSVLFLSLRGGAPEGDRRFDLRWAYLPACLISAAMIKPGHDGFYLSLALLCAWLLWHAARGSGERRGNLSRALALTASLSLGWVLGLGMVQAQAGMEGVIVRMFERWIASSLDPFHSTTAIGEVGHLKGSERIEIRFIPDADAAALERPLLLRAASYDRYVDGSWFATPTEFKLLDLDGRSWSIPDDHDAQASAEPLPGRIIYALPRGRGLLPLPSATRRIDGLTGADLERNPFGTLRIEDGPAIAGYRVARGDHLTPRPPTDTDLRVTVLEGDALTGFLRRHRLQGLPPESLIANLRTIFLREYRYSVQLARTPANRGPVAYFLDQSKSGHCEYFATATALLLRRAGVPTRYVRGWSVQEYSALEDAYVARARHAHAWVMAWYDGAWHNVDLTPPDWGELEHAERPWWGAGLDLIERARYLLRGGDQEQPSQRHWLLIPLLVLVIVLAWRVIRRGRHSRSKRIAGNRKSRLPSPLEPIEQVLAKRGLGRRIGETPLDWARRLQDEGHDCAASLRDLLETYYPQRFDPTRDDATTRAGSRERIAELAKRLRRCSQR